MSLLNSDDETVARFQGLQAVRGWGSAKFACSKLGSIDLIADWQLLRKVRPKPSCFQPSHAHWQKLLQKLHVKGLHKWQRKIEKNGKRFLRARRGGRCWKEIWKIFFFFFKSKLAFCLSGRDKISARWDDWQDRDFLTIWGAWLMIVKIGFHRWPVSAYDTMANRSLKKKWQIESLSKCRG